MRTYGGAHHFNLYRLLNLYRLPLPLQGGSYAPENVATYRRSLAAINAHAAATQASQLELLTATQAELASKVWGEGGRPGGEQDREGSNRRAIGGHFKQLSATLAKPSCKMDERDQEMGRGPPF